MAYAVSLKKSAEKELDHLPDRIHQRIVEHLIALKSDPRPAGIKKLHGKEGYRLRVGAYRILYSVNDSSKHVEIFSIAHRKEVYR